MFCRNCGKELIGTPEICPECGAKPMSGTSFCSNCGAATTELTEICPKCGARMAGAAAKPIAGDISPKSRLAITLLAFFLGTLGVHRFYLGKIGTAVGMLILGIVGWATIWIFGLGFIFLTAVGIWALIDFIFAVSGRMRDTEGKLIEKW